MPSRIDKHLFVPMTKEQMGMHSEWQNQVRMLVMKWQKHHFLSEKDRNRLLLHLSQMRMVCDSSYILDQKTRYDTKVDECINLISDIVCEEGEKVVVFSQWERMTRLVAKELRKKGIGFEYLHGGVPSEKRKDMVDNFTNNAESRVFLSTDAGSTGLNLQVAANIINIDLPWNPAVLEQRIGRIYRLGQQNNIQVINLVAPHSIEEAMVGKLRFKTSMFEGVFDNGEDSIFADDNKFGKIMETVSSFVSEEDNSMPDGKKEDEIMDAEAAVISEDNEEAAEESNVTPEEDFNTEDSPYTKEYLPDGNAIDDSRDTPNESFGNISDTKSHKTAQPKELVEQGVSFLSGLAQTLKSPEATAALVDSITEKDEKTGETSIKIPVESKETVKNLLDLIGKLFAK